MTRPADDSEALFVERPILSRRRRVLILLIGPLAFAAVGGWISTTGRLDPLERLSVDGRFRHRGPLSPDPRIVITEITEEGRRSLSTDREERFELREHLDDAIRHLADAG